MQSFSVLHSQLSLNFDTALLRRASQPRNALLGQAIALSIALAVMLPTRFYQGPEEAPPLATNLHRSVGTALAICIMARLGVTHPVSLL